MAERSRPRVIDESPLSEFIMMMRDAHLRRLAADTPAEKRTIDREMTGLMVKYLGRDAWEAAVEAEKAAGVPRATRRRARFGAPSKYSGDGIDRKLAAAGDRERDDE